MGFRFKRGERLAKGVLRVGKEQLKQIGRDLEGDTVSQPSVHDARKSLKRLRALLRLVRPAVEKSWWRRQNAALGEMSRALADVRDIESLAECLDRLKARFPALRRARSVAALKKVLLERRHAVVGAQWSELTSTLRPALKSVRREFLAVRFGARGFGLAGPGLALTCDAGRRAMRRAYKGDATEDFHDWRKHVQRHWRHLQLFRDAWPAEMALRIHLARELSEILGDLNDLDLLLAAIERRGPASVAKAARAELAGFIRERQRELKALAFPRGQTLFAEPGGELARRLERYWRHPFEPLA